MRNFILAGVVLVALLGAAPAVAAGDPRSGEELAVEHCQRCHVVSRDNPYAGVGNTPSFFVLAARDDWLERFSTFFDRRPHPVFVQVPDVPAWSDSPSPMATFRMTLQDIIDLIAFVETLREE